MSPPAPAVSTVRSWAGATRERSRARGAPAVTERIRFTGRSSLAGRGYPFATRARGESLGRGLGLRALIQGTLGRDGEPHAHGRPGPQLRVYRDAPGEHVPHDALHRHEPQAAPFAELFGREARFENALKVLRANARSLIPDREMERVDVLREAHADRRLPHDAGVRRVPDQVHEQIVQPVRIAPRIDALHGEIGRAS